MNLIRKFLIRVKVWGWIYPPHNFMGVKVHRDWPWRERKRLKADDIVSVQPMTAPSKLTFKFVYEENEE